MGIDQAKFDAFMGRVVGDLGAAASAAMVLVGDRLGLYKAMAGAGGMTPSDLAKRTKTAERYVREWLGNQAAGGYVEYDAKKRTYTLPPEQAFALADEASPAFVPGGFQAMLGAARSVERLVENFKTGAWMAWGDHHHDLFHGTERFFRPNYVGNLVANWIPALDGVKARLEWGIRVADVGCGHGASTILMATAYPKSTFVGFDSHAPSVESARARAKAAGVGDRARFEVARANDYPGTYDFVTFFHCLHDLADPVGASKQTKKNLDPKGSWMIVEPFSGDNVADNLNPVGRVFYAASTMICVPCSLAGNGPALGAQAGEARLRDVVVRQGGFHSMKRVTETPFNLVLEAKP